MEPESPATEVVQAELSAESVEHEWNDEITHMKKAPVKGRGAFS